MLHEIRPENIGPLGQPMADAVQTCVHCGFCLPACPTYQVLGEEMDSPRGRIFLMKEVLEGRVAMNEVTPYTDRCLGCLGCVTACPSGVRYDELITPFRAHSESLRRRSWWDRLLRRFLLETLPYPERFRLAIRLGKLGQVFQGLLPGRLRDMTKLLPAHVPARQPLPEVFPAEGPRRARVALLAGCAQQVLAPEIGWATLRVLARNGVEVVIPRSQGCCGALAAHTGALQDAQACAKRNLAAFPTDVDAVLTNAAGCGSGMHEYALWLRGQPEEARAAQFVKQVQDVSVFLAKIGFTPPPPLAQPLALAYHDACHLAHAQKVKAQPRQLLASVSGLRIVPIPDGEICCGSAGTYNLEQPEIAHQLGQQKASAVRSTGAQLVATGNIGCLTQLVTHLGDQPRTIPVLHTMQVLDLAYERRLNDAVGSATNK